MKPAPFEYHRPDSVEEALALLVEHGYDAKLLAGGQSLIPTMNFRLAQPALLVDLNQIPQLSYIRDGDGAVEIGAMARQRQVERSASISGRAPLLAEALPHVAHPQIRNRGTIGGTLAHADPAAELPAVMLALDAAFTLRGPYREREVPATEFFTGLFGTALEPEEMLTAVRIPAIGQRTGHAFAEIARRHGDYALAGVACVVTLDEQGRCATARVALFGVGGGPVLSEGAAEAILGGAPTEEAIRAAAAAAAGGVDPSGDIHASAEYRRHLVEVLVRRTLPRAFERARASTTS